CALKELTIENEIKKLADTWQEQRFDLHKYHSVSRWGQSSLGPPVLKSSLWFVTLVFTSKINQGLTACTR
ncbi:hypothetical protein, partial [Enterococcus casseliflavus]|uniref:hypothetical protein n=1 Tax=Enterococcus casseliflavus TaxID=37734 RepID=UPI003D09B2AD